MVRECHVSWLCYVMWCDVALHSSFKTVLWISNIDLYIVFISFIGMHVSVSPTGIGFVRKSNKY